MSAVRGLRAAASRRNARAALAWARALSPITPQLGRIEKNAHASLRWLYRARALGEARADVLLGFALFHGIGTESLAEEGLRRLRAAAAAGWADALIHLIESLECIGPTAAEHEALCSLCRHAQRRLKRLPAEERRGERERLRAYARELLAKSKRMKPESRQPQRQLRYAQALTAELP